MHKKHNSQYQQMDFFNLLDSTALTSNTVSSDVFKDNPPPKKLQPRKKLSKKQQMGFREDYNQAMITLYVFGCLFRNEVEKANAPEEIKNEVEKAKKTQIRYERYMPKASQKIIHYGRDVIDACMYADRELSELRAEAENSRYRDKWHMYVIARDTLDRMVNIIRQHNKD